MKSKKISKTAMNFTKFSEFKRLLMVACGLLLVSCKPDYPANPKPILHSTISADGQLVATLLNAGTLQQRLRVLHLGQSENWEEIKVPEFTQTIHFGISAHELLLTNKNPIDDQDKLIILDLDDLNSGPTTIYQTDELGFPQQVAKDEFIVEGCTKGGAQSSKIACNKRHEFRWLLISHGKEIQKLGTNETGYKYSYPVLINDGVIWIAEQTGKSQDSNPLLLSAALPGGQAPTFPRDRLDKDTWEIACDRSGKRCLRKFITNLNSASGHSFRYDVDVLFGSERCTMEGVSGSIDEFSVTPNGLSAVLSLAPAYDQPRHVVVIKFNGTQCQASSIRHIHFKGD